MLTTP